MCLSLSRTVVRCKRAVEWPSTQKYGIVTTCKFSVPYGKEGATRESMRRLAATLMKASLLCGKPLWSRAKRRQRVIQARIRSTIHLQGETHARTAHLSFAD